MRVLFVFFPVRIRRRWLRWIALFLGTGAAGVVRSAEWTLTSVPETVSGLAAMRTYRCFLKVPDSMTSRSAVDLWSDSIMLSVADLSVPFVIRLNGQGLAAGPSVPKTPRRRFKVPKGILERGQYNVVSIRLESPYESCMVWRYHPERRVYEIFAEGGGNNFGLEFDAAGRLYTGHNGGQTRGWHFIPGGNFLKEGKEHGKFGPPSNPYAFGELPMMTSRSSITRFSHHFAIAEGNALPVEAIGELFSVDPLHHQVIHSHPERTGSTFATADIDLPLQSDDPSVRPVFIANAPDGSLYVADFDEEYIAHGQNYQGQIDADTGRLYRLRAAGGTLNKEVNLQVRSTLELLALLSHPNRWQRQTAVRLLGERRDPAAAPVLREFLRAPAKVRAPAAGPATRVLAVASDHPALEALWALSQGNWLTEDDLLVAWQHASPAVRGWAIRLASDGPELSPTLLDSVCASMGREPDAEVRSLVAASARRLPAGPAVRLLRAVWERDVDVDDPYIPLLCWHGLERVVGLAPEVVLRETERQAFWRSQLARRHLHGRLMRRWAGESTQAALQACIRLFRAAPNLEARRALVPGFEEAFSGRGVSLLPADLLAALQGAGANPLVLRLRQGEPGAAPEAMERAAKESVPLAERLRWIRLLGELRAAAAVDFLLGLVRTNGPIDPRRVALAALAEFEDPRIGVAIADAYADLPAPLRSAAQGVLSSRTAWIPPLLGLLERGVFTEGELTAEADLRLGATTDPELKRRFLAWKARRVGRLPEASRQESARIRRELVQGPGSSYRGELIFMERCASCHQLFHKGGHIGPNLTTYQRDDLSTLLPSLLEPSLEIREGFRNYLLTTTDGRVLSGLVIDQTAQQVVLRGLDGEDVAIPRAAVQSLAPMDASLMPGGLLDDLDGQQLRDFFAYLRIPQPISR